MALSYTTPDGTLLVTPQAVVGINVVANPSNLSTSGTLMVLGEAAGGPDFSKETDLGSNSFGPDQLADVIAKYKSGPLVDAMKGAIVAANDAGISGSFTSFIPVKTNQSVKAKATLLNQSSGTYGVLQDTGYGALGNLTSYQVNDAQDEVQPTTGNFALLLPIGSTHFEAYFDGAHAGSITLSALELPSAAVTTINTAINSNGLQALGGNNRGVLGSVVGSLALAVVSDNTVTVTYTQNFGATAQSGDTMYIPSGSVLATSNADAAGSYIVTTATSTVITAIKLLDVTGAHNSLTPPTSKSSTAVAATTDVQVFAPVSVTTYMTGTNPVAGVGKTIQLVSNQTTTGLLTDICYVLVGATPTVSPWIATEIVSAAESQVSLSDGNTSLSVSEMSSAVGGAIALYLSFVTEDTAATASITVTATGVTINATASDYNSGSPFTATVTFAQYPKIGDLVNWINSVLTVGQGPFGAKAATALVASRACTTLDQGTFSMVAYDDGSGIVEVNGTPLIYPCRIKRDADAFQQAVNGLTLVSLVARATAGLPLTTSTVAFLSGGVVGGTSDANIESALTALTMVRGNFVIPCFSRDAVSDIADDLTDPSSTYTIEAIHTNTRAHVIQMSTLKAGRNRQAFLSIRDTFANDQTVAENLASARCSCAFEDCVDTDANGDITQFQPWMTAIKAAGVQAAAFYKPIFAKGVNVSGVLQAAGDFNDQDDDAVETAELSGLLPIVRNIDGSFSFTSDQTTYGVDDNFVFNSIQAMYAADLCALTYKQRLQKAFVGQSVADVTAPQFASVFGSISGDLLRLKLISPSSDAPAGFKDLKVQIKAPVINWSAGLKLSTGIYYIVGQIQISQVQSSS